jgi:hypothetical protein
MAADFQPVPGCRAARKGPSAPGVNGAVYESLTG